MAKVEDFTSGPGLTADSAALQGVLAAITEEELIELAMELVRRPSPTGHELKVGEFVADWFERNGLDVKIQRPGGERINVIATIKGSGEGVSLSLNGHMDVPYSGSEEDLASMSKEQFKNPAHSLEPWVKDGYILGVGIGNMKASLAALMIAMKAVKQSGIKLKGDLIAACGCGEIGRMPFGAQQGLEYEGSGFGARYMVTHGIHSDYAICVDNSGLKLTWVQPGLVFLSISVFGLPGGAWATGGSKDKAASQNAIVKAQPVIDALEDWAAGYNAQDGYKCAGGHLKPTAAVTSVQAGTPVKASQRPGICRMTLNVLIAPGVQPMQILREVTAVARGITPDVEVELCQATLGYEAKGVDGLVSIMHDTHRALYGEPIEICDIPYCSVYTDSSTYNQNGIPCVKFGLGLSAQERMVVGNDAYDMHRIADMVKGARLYASFGVNICTQTKLD